MSKFTQESYGSAREILKFSEFTAVSVVVSDEGAVVSEGKKVVAAGTIVGGRGKDVLVYPNEPVVKSNDDGAQGVLLADVDVTYGPATGSMVIHGFVNLAALPEAPTADAVTALNMIKFMN